MRRPSLQQGQENRETHIIEVGGVTCRRGRDCEKSEEPLVEFLCFVQGPYPWPRLRHIVVLGALLDLSFGICTAHRERVMVWLRGEGAT